MTADTPDRDAEAWQRKIDHRLHALLARTPALDRARQQVRVLVRFAGSPELLQRLGVQVGSVAGDIASGTLGLVDVPDVASAPEIIFIELAQQMWPDPSNDVAGGLSARGDVDA